MYGIQPESQLLLLWSSHRRRLIYSAKPMPVPSPQEFRAIKCGLASLSLVVGSALLAWHQMGWNCGA